MTFRNAEDSHAHSLDILNLLYEYDDFMESVGTVVDLGCGSGLDLEWWATRTTRDDEPTPLNIRCFGVDQQESLKLAKKYPNITYQQTDFETTIHPPKTKFDVLWCHDAFQYAVDPIKTLSNWWSIAADSAMLSIIVPQTTNFVERQHNFESHSGCFYHYTLVNLIYMLATAGWDCKSGFFLRPINENWVHAIVYKSPQAPMDPKKVSWHQLRELGLLPDSVDKSIMSHNYVRQQDLTLPWIDHSLNWYGRR